MKKKTKGWGDREHLCSPNGKESEIKVGKGRRKIARWQAHRPGDQSHEQGKGVFSMPL